MAFFHFVNCVLVVFAPVGVLKQSLQQSDDDIGLSYATALGVFLGTQLVKMLALANLQPFAATGDGALPWAEATANLIDVAGLLALMRMSKVPKKMQVGSRDPVAIANVGVGAFALEAYLACFAPAFCRYCGFVAAAPDFTWAHLISALEGNVDLVNCISIVMALRIWFSLDVSKDLHAATMATLAAFFMYSAYRAPLAQWVSRAAFGGCDWSTLACSAGGSVLFAGALFALLRQRLGK